MIRARARVCVCVCVCVFISCILLPGSLFWCLVNFGIFTCVCAQSLQSCLTLCDTMNCSSAGSPLYGILQARILEWVAISFSRGFSQPRDGTVSLKSPALASRFFTTSATWEAPEYSQFSSVTQSCPTLCDLMDCSTPDLPIHHQLPELTQTHVHWVGDAIQPSHPQSPLLLPPSIFPSINVFSNESALHIRWPKYWGFSFNISHSNEYSGLIFFRMDWLDLLESPRDSQEFSPTPEFKSINYLALSFLYSQHSHPHDYWKNHSLD